MKLARMCNFTSRPAIQLHTRMLAGFCLNYSEPHVHVGRVPQLPDVSVPRVCIQMCCKDDSKDKIVNDSSGNKNPRSEQLKVCPEKLCVPSGCETILTYVSRYEQLSRVEIKRRFVQLCVIFPVCLMPHESIRVTQI